MCIVIIYKIYIICYICYMHGIYIDIYMRRQNLAEQIYI